MHPNWQNRTMWTGDNLDIMRGMNSASVDLIYLMHFPFRNLTIDHVVPQTKGGTDHADNLQLLCGACNSTKGTGTQEELIARLRAEGIRVA